MRQKSLSGVDATLLLKKWVRREQESLSPILRRHGDLVVAEAKGVEIKTVEGRKFVDLTGGFHVGSLGYSHPAIIKATKEQLGSLDFFPHYLGLAPIRVELAEKLLAVAPRGLRDGKVAYCNTGSDAAEFAIKLTRYVTGRTGLIACMGAYHGGTMGGLSLTIDSSKLRKGYGPFLPDVFFVGYPNRYRDQSENDREAYWKRCIEEFEYLFDAVVQPDEVAAVFIEPIQAHGGVIIPPVEYFKALRKLCSDNGILLVADEVVTGFGRTGRMFGMEHFGVKPDVMFLGKPMGAGLPLGAIVGTNKVMDRWTTDGPASTLAASTLACARCLALIRTIESDKLLQNAEKVGSLILRRFSEMAGKRTLIGDIRGKGLLIAVELVKDLKTKAPATKEVEDVAERAYRRGLLLGVSGRFGNVLKLTPPLILTIEQADAAIDVIEECLRETETAHLS